MKLEKWALVAEIISSSAIVLTLILLVLELRDNTLAVNASTRQSIAQRTEMIALATATTPSLGQALAAANRSDVLPTTGANAFHTALMRNLEEAYLQWQDGRLDEGYFTRRAAAALMGPLSSDFFANRLRRDRDFFDPSFIAWIDRNYPEYLAE